MCVCIGCKRKASHRVAVMLLLALAGCESLRPSEPATRQVANNPFSEPRRLMTPRVNVPPAPVDVAERVECVRGQLVGANLEKTGLRPNVTAVSAASPEVFHLNLNQIYITDALVRQCQTDGQLAAVLANEMGRMVAEREASVADALRASERMPPIAPPIGGANVASDPLYQVELARYEQHRPQAGKKLPLPSPQAVARNILERAGYARTELESAAGLLQVAGTSTQLEDQFRGTIKQSDWQPR